MGLRRGRPLSAELEALGLFVQLDAQEPRAHSKVNDPARTAAVVDKLTAALATSMGSPGRLHGFRVQALFEAVVVALGSVKLIKPEDTGSYFVDDTQGEVKPPDFQVILSDGDGVLVEVKNVAPQDISKPFKMRRKDFDAHRRYADMAGSRLMFAHYWSAARMWTLVDGDVLMLGDKYVELTFESAAIANQMSRLGDVWVGTTPPLTFTVLVDPEDQKRIPANDDGTHQAVFKIAGVEVAAAGQALIEPVQIRIAMILMLYGGWSEDSIVEYADDGTTITRIVITVEPPVEDDIDVARIVAQGFALIGTLSGMYSLLSERETIAADGEFLALHYEPDPGMMRDVIPNDYLNRDNDALPIWLLYQQPG
ncbi:hypothetical protein [Nocardia sp. CS682]|uniref:hypothetical protein n=1 Tax=Nocardia sp. CS682 TaxID=1047172 RepID=UPI001074A20A|nr:hypothetical protein [Nocardia sp. CS682]QBS40385.1 hypothetical protein DMB37_09920 [Nocardia sp. CS682]